MSLIDVLPDPVNVSEEMLAECRESSDFRPIIFEYYKKTAILCTICANLLFENESWIGSRQRWTVLVGLLNRCTRIMAGNLEFFQDGRFGDLTPILERCLLETCVKIRWISCDCTDARLKRYFEDSLQSDKELFDAVNSNISSRGGVVLAIESRMLKSIGTNADFAGINLTATAKLRRAPSLADMIDAIGEKRFVYTVIGKIASHSVHGSLANLLHFYLESVGKGLFAPAHKFPESHVNQFIFDCMFVIDACVDFLKMNFQSCAEIAYLAAILKSYQDEIKELNSEIVGTDFAP